MPTINIASRKTSDFASGRRSWGSLFEVGLFIVLIVLAYIYLIGPKRTEAQEKKNKLEQLTEDLNKLERQKRSFERLVQQLEENRDQVRALDEALPLETELGRLYILTEYLAQSAGMGSSSVSIEHEAKNPVAGDRDQLAKPFQGDRALTVTPITLNAIGTIDQLMGFLSLVETSNRLLDTTAITISPGRADQFIFKISLQAYSFSPKTETTQPASRPAPSTAPVQ